MFYDWQNDVPVCCANTSAEQTDDTSDINKVSHGDGGEAHNDKLNNCSNNPKKS